MKVTVDHKDLNLILDLLPPFSQINGQNREAVMRVVSAASRGMVPVRHEVYVAIGENKIAAIRFIRAVFGMGLKEAKDAVEAIGKPVGILQGTIDQAQSMAREYRVSARFVEKRH